MNPMKKCLVIMALFLCTRSHAQSLSIATNALEYVNFCTLNAEVGLAVGRHLSVTAGALYNPWDFGDGDSGIIRNRQRTFNLGVRWWPWNIYSGWWVSMKGQYREYNGNPFSRGGITKEGDAVGAGIALGYALMLSRHFNLDFGAGFWAGSEYRRNYSCPTCGDILEEGRGGFFRPDNVHASIVYIF